MLRLAELPVEELRRRYRALPADHPDRDPPPQNHQLDAAGPGREHIYKRPGLAP